MKKTYYQPQIKTLSIAAGRFMQDDVIASLPVKTDKEIEDPNDILTNEWKNNLWDGYSTIPDNEKRGMAVGHPPFSGSYILYSIVFTASSMPFS